MADETVLKGLGSVSYVSLGARSEVNEVWEEVRLPKIESLLISVCSCLLLWRICTIINWQLTWPNFCGSKATRIISYTIWKGFRMGFIGFPWFRPVSGMHNGAFRPLQELDVKAARSRFEAVGQASVGCWWERVVERASKLLEVVLWRKSEAWGDLKKDYYIWFFFLKNKCIYVNLCAPKAMVLSFGRTWPRLSLWEAGNWQMGTGDDLGGLQVYLVLGNHFFEQSILYPLVNGWTPGRPRFSKETFEIHILIHA